ncbi:MAG: thiol:disulfide interchange protein precursor, partial [Proteobacteria bacterium]|nr:thiol:disulfide interchange protein precursor [Pseudomonadota bacterium]
MDANVTLLAAFGAGLLSFVSPCVLPLVPPYLGYLTGASIEELTGEEMSRLAAKRRVAEVALSFILGFTCVFVALGATASVFGQLVRQWSEVLGTLAGLFIIVMGLHFLGLFRVALFYREARFHDFRAKAG